MGDKYLLWQEKGAKGSAFLATAKSKSTVTVAIALSKCKYISLSYKPPSNHRKTTNLSYFQEHGVFNRWRTYRQIFKDQGYW